MRRRTRRIIATALGASMLLPVALAPADGDAVTWAEGEGGLATGGRGGDVYYVTNLDDSGPGSLRDGIDSATGPRTILFNVAGTIHLQSNLNITKPNLTIAGQSAPGGGITLADRQVLIQNTQNVIFQFIRTRAGDTYSRSPDNPYEPDSLGVWNSSNILVDHVSASWSVDEVLSVSHGSTDVTVQWSYITEALRDGGHSKGNHSYGSIIDGGDITFHHNLYASNESRNPRPGGQTTRLDFVNNVISNPGFFYGYVGGADVIDINYVGNYGIAGPNTTASSLLSQTHEDIRVYQAGNFIDTDKDGVLDGVAATGSAGVSGSYTPLAQRVDLAEVATTDARQAYIQVMSRAGASAFRDAVDQRVVRDVLNQGGSIIDSQNQVGGWAVLPSGAAPQDSNGDGVPDAYAASLGFGVNDAIGQQTAANGRTYLENYLFSRVSHTYAPAGPIHELGVSTRFGQGGDANVSENTVAGQTTSGGSTGPALNARWNGEGNASRNEYILLKFDLAAITPGTVTDAALDLTAYRNFTGTHQLNVYGVNNDAANWDWEEDAAGFDHTPGLAYDGDSSTRGTIADQLIKLGTLDASGASAGDVLRFDNANLAVFLNLASYYEDDAQAGVVTLLLERVNSSETQTRFASWEAITLEGGFNPLGATEAGAYAPLLLVQAVDATQTPEPATCLLMLGLGLALLLRHRRVAAAFQTIENRK